MFWIANWRAFFTSSCNSVARHDPILNLRRFITGLVVVFVIIIGRYIVCLISLLRCSSVKTKRSWIWKQTMGIVLIDIIFIWSSICRLMGCGRGFYRYRKRTSGLQCVDMPIWICSWNVVVIWWFNQSQLWKTRLTLFPSASVAMYNTLWTPSPKTCPGKKDAVTCCIFTLS